MSVCIILRLKNWLHVRSNDLMIIFNHKSSPHDKEMIFELKNTSNVSLISNNLGEFTPDVVAD